MTDVADDREMTVPASVTLDGRSYPVAWSICGHCKNWWLTVALPEFAPSCCCYCGQKFRFFEDGEGGRRGLHEAQS